MNFTDFHIAVRPTNHRIMKLFRVLVFAQSTYLFVTAMWALLHIESFMRVTGPKTDIWLVKTVGALLLPIAACLATYLFIKVDRRPAFVLGCLTALAFISVDFYYALNDVISDIYLADGVVEIIFFVTWIYIARKRYKVLKYRW